MGGKGDRKVGRDKEVGPEEKKRKVKNGQEQKTKN